MSWVVNPRVVLPLPIANVAFPTFLIVLIFLVVGMGVGGIIIAGIYLLRKRSTESEPSTDR